MNDEDFIAAMKDVSLAGLVREATKEETADYLVKAVKYWDLACRIDLAACDGDIETLKKIFSNIKGSYRCDYHTFKTVVWKGYTEIVKLLLEVGMEIDEEYEDETVLMVASRQGYTEIVKLLLGHGVDVNAKDYKGWTALMEAVGKGHIEIVKLLKQHGAKE